MNRNNNDYILAQTTDEVPARESGDVFEIFDLERGLVCRGQHQKTGVCQGNSHQENIRVRFTYRVQQRFMHTLYNVDLYS